MTKRVYMAAIRATRVRRSHRALFVAAVFYACALLTPARADESSAAANPQPKSSTPSAMVSLINRLMEHGVLSKQDASDLIIQADADAADARVQAAEAILAAAKAEAAAARARADAARANAALARAQANAAQVAANPAAAVRLLLGQGTTPGSAVATAAPAGSTGPSPNDAAGNDEEVPLPPAPRARAAAPSVAETGGSRRIFSFG